MNVNVPTGGLLVRKAKLDVKRQQVLNECPVDTWGIVTVGHMREETI